MESFISKFKEQFEDAESIEIGKETVYKSLESWDSLTAFSILAMIKEEYNPKVSLEDINDCNTVRELYVLVVEANR